METNNTPTEQKTLLFSYAHEVLNGTRIEQRWHEIHLRYEPRHFRLNEWAHVEELLHKSPLWAQVALGLRDVEKIKDNENWDAATDPIGRWSPVRFGEYRDILVNFLSCFATPETRPALTGLRLAEESSREECALLAQRVTSVLNAYYEEHEPQLREAFDYKGATYVIRYDEQLYGKFLTWGEATEALQMQEAYESSERDAQAFEQRSAHVVAAFARKVVRKDKKTGAFAAEKKPTTLEGWQQHIEQRRQHFADLPMDIVMDVGFFLTVSYVKQSPTLSMGLHLNNFLNVFNTHVKAAKKTAVAAASK